MKRDISLTVLIPAFNEAGSISAAIDSVQLAVDPHVRTYELLVIDDGSSDRTAQIVRERIRSDPRITLIRHDRNRGLGDAFRSGIRAAKGEYLTEFHGDNDADSSFLREFIRLAGTADIITIYPVNRSVRSLSRRLFSACFIRLMNALFGMRSRYFNGTFLCRTAMLRRIHVRSSGLAVYAEAKIRLVTLGYTYREIPFKQAGRKAGTSKAVNLRSFFATAQTIFGLFWDIHIRHRP